MDPAEAATPCDGECAAAAAAWLSFGHDPATVSFVFDDGRWRVRFG